MSHTSHATYMQLPLTSTVTCLTFYDVLRDASLAVWLTCEVALGQVEAC